MTELIKLTSMLSTFALIISFLINLVMMPTTNLPTRNITNAMKMLMLHGIT